MDGLHSSTISNICVEYFQDLCSPQCGNKLCVVHWSHFVKELAQLTHFQKFENFSNGNEMGVYSFKNNVRTKKDCLTALSVYLYM